MSVVWAIRWRSGAGPSSSRHRPGQVGQSLYLEAEVAGLRGTGIGCFFDDPVHEMLGLADDAYQSLYHFTLGHPVEDTRLLTLPPYADQQRARVGYGGG